MKMTEQRLKELAALANDPIARKLSLRNALDELIYEVRRQRGSISQNQVEGRLPMSDISQCKHENMEMYYAPIVGGGGAVKEPIGEYCTECGYSPDGLAIAIRKEIADRYDD